MRFQRLRRERGRRRAFLLLTFVLAMASPVAAFGSEPLPPRYHAAGMDSWDFWYVHSNGLYYVFYLQSLRDAPVRFVYSTIGMATSPDLIHWTEYGEVLRANPRGQWNDAWVATGSSWWVDDHWQMVFTGQSSTSYRGIGLARSDDLEHWTRIGSGPVTLNQPPFVVPESDYWQEKGYPVGQRLTYTVLADPYVYPEPVDGWYYMVVNALLDGAPLEQRGCIPMLRSRDGRVWDSVGIIAHPKIFDQMETPELWKHGDRWYLIFGAARANPVYRATMVYTAPTMFGPFEPSPRPEITLPDNPGWFYVAKVVTNPQGQDVLMGHVGGTLSHPYPVTYEADGSLTLSTLDAIVPQWVPAGLPNFPGPLVSDLAGGVISNGVTRVNANGFPLWGPVTGNPTQVWASDGLGGAIGAAYGTGDMAATRTTATGTQPWGTSVTVCDAPQNQLGPAIAADGVGGAFVAWMDTRSGTNFDLYAQHVDASGQPTWAANGVAVCTEGSPQSGIVIVADGTGGAIMAWRDDRSAQAGGADLYAQRIDASGAVQWAADGIPVGAAVGVQEAPVIVTDGAGGAFIAWWDARGGPRDVYMQHLDASGTATWAANGLLVAGGANDQLLPVLAADGAHGVFVAWEDHRAGRSDGLDIYAQHLDASGAPMWTPGGAPVCTEFHAQTRPSLVQDGAGGIIVAWMDTRDASLIASYAPYVQRLDASGTPMWNADGVRVEYSNGTTAPAPPSIAPDGSGGVFVSGTAGLQRVLADGQLAWIPSFTPTITSITDVSGDEGGYVRIAFAAPLAQTANFAPGIVGYNVWRRIARTSSRVTDRPPAGWEIVMHVFPAGIPSYTVVAPTREDATPGDSTSEAYAISAHTAAPQFFLPSTPVAGISIDNLAPRTPLNLAGGLAGASTVRLVWSAGGERDLEHYNVYRGASALFVPAPQSLIGSTAADTWDDPAFEPGVSYYKVTAIDRHGNESAAATLSPDRISNEPPGRVPSVSYVAHPTPNPMSDGTTIEYGLARASAVSLAVYDLGGREVRTLVDAVVPAGQWRVHWGGDDSRGRRVPSGIYLVRFVAEGIRQTRKLIVTS
jgi:hypothetical protein